MLLDLNSWAQVILPLSLTSAGTTRAHHCAQFFVFFFFNFYLKAM